MQIGELSEQSSVELTHKIYFKNNPNLLYNKINEVISCTFKEKLEELGICAQIPLLEDICSPYIIKHKETLFLKNGCKIESISTEYTNFELNHFTINDEHTDISPHSLNIGHQTCFTFDVQKIGKDKSELESHIRTGLLKHYDLDVIICLCESTNSTGCTCITEHVSCDNSYEKDNLSQKTYNVDQTPNFIEQIPISFWTNFQPDIVVSYQEDNDIRYKNVAADAYSYSPLEKQYLNSSHCGSSSNDTVKKILVNGRCVASISTVDGGNRMVVMFYSNEIFLIMGVPDLRYLWCGDGIFRDDVLAHLVNKLLLFFLLLLSNPKRCSRK